MSLRNMTYNIKIDLRIDRKIHYNTYVWRGPLAGRKSVDNGYYFS